MTGVSLRLVFGAVTAAVIFGASASPLDQIRRFVSHTTVVVIRNAEEVVIAADSRQVQEDSRALGQETPEETCKLHRIRGIAVAAIGLVRFNGTSDGLFWNAYDAHEMAEKHLGQEGALATRLQAFDVEMRTAFGSAMRTIRNVTPGGIVGLPPRPEDALQMVFVSATLSVASRSASARTLRQAP